MVIASRAVEVRRDLTATMRAAVFRAPGDIGVEEVPKPIPGPGEAVIRVTLTTICGTDVHIYKGEYPVRPGSRTLLRPTGSSATASMVC